MSGDPARARADEIALHLLVLRCQAGDEQAFAKLMGRFGPETLRYLRSVVADDAEDVQQEVWLTVYRRISTLADPGALRTWLFRTSRHRAIDFLRTRRRERELLADDPEAIESVADETHEGDASALPTDTTSGDDRLGGSSDGAALQAALDTLSPAQREVLQLRFQNDLSYEEIAVVLGVKVGTVRSRLHYAKQRVHEAITRGSTEE